MKAKAKKNGKKLDRHGEQRGDYEVILLRVRPEIRALLDETVASMNKERRVGDPPYSLTGVILMAIANTFGTDGGKGRKQLAFDLRYVKAAAS